MTNTELIAKIKAEIKKLIERYGSVKANGVLQEGYKGGRLIGYEDVLNILKRIQEESEKPIGLEEEISKSIESLEGCTTKVGDAPEYHLISDEGLREFAHHFAEWGAEHPKK